jgi:hypothetical protein
LRDPSVMVQLCQFKFRLFLRPTVSRPDYPGVEPPSEAHDQIFSTFGHLRSSCWVAPSLTRRRVCNSLVRFAVTLRSKSRRTHNHILLSHTRPPPPPSWIARSPVFTSPKKRVAQLYPRALGFGYSDCEIDIRLFVVNRSFSLPPHICCSYVTPSDDNFM